MLFRFKKAPSGSAKDILSICIGRNFRASNADSHFHAMRARLIKLGSIRGSRVRAMKKGPVPNRGEALAFISASLKELEALRGGSRVLSRRLTGALDAHGGCGGFTWVTASPIDVSWPREPKPLTGAKKRHDVGAKKQPDGHSLRQMPLISLNLLSASSCGPNFGPNGQTRQ
ncbi:hypothetical protein NKJ84_31015 [Mesorhizobium sp. M0048]|uniref:hypothetical protein n=1 Tax=Mesorhizobium sp. M0048 TaxID=2956860 RepID=UPI003335B681